MSSNGGAPVARRIHALPRGTAKRARAAAARARNARFTTALRPDAQGPVVIVSPHLDDAVFSCFSLLKPGTRVVNVFAGIPPKDVLARWDRVCRATNSAERARDRRAEDAAALATVGITPDHLRFLDIEARDFAPPPSFASIDAALATVTPTASAVYATAGVGGHADHVTVREYARSLARAGIPVWLYAEMPYSVQHGWPHWVTGRPPDRFVDPDVFLASYLGAVPEAAPLTGADIARLDATLAKAKLTAMRLYRSQYPALDGGASGVLTNPANHAFEVFWPLNRG